MMRQEFSKSISTESKRSGVGEVFRPLVQILKLFGHCPLVYRKTGKVGQSGTGNWMCELGVYEFRWQSPWNLWSACCTIFYTTMWVIYVAEGLTDFRLYNKDGLALLLKGFLW